MIDQGSHCNDTERLRKANAAQECQQRLLTTRIALTSIKDELTEAERQDDADSCAGQKYT